MQQHQLGSSFAASINKLLVYMNELQHRMDKIESTKEKESPNQANKGIEINSEMQDTLDAFSQRVDYIESAQRDSNKILNEIKSNLSESNQQNNDQQASIEKNVLLKAEQIMNNRLTDVKTRQNEVLTSLKTNHVFSVDKVNSEIDKINTEISILKSTMSQDDVLKIISDVTHKVEALEGTIEQLTQRMNENENKEQKEVQTQEQEQEQIQAQPQQKDTQAQAQAQASIPKQPQATSQKEKQAPAKRKGKNTIVVS